MRKFLSLVLALVMMMSLVTINVGAKEFSDDGDITYKEAVDVISTIHVVDGYTDGGFKPGNNLSRGAAAKIICNLILGPTTAAELHADTAPYRDVPVTNEFAGYIAYCQKDGIISGYADGSFRPAGTLTGYAFMKMLLGALGYDAEIEGYTGPNWSINVAKRAIGIGLNASLEKTFNGVEFVTREEAALYAFNTLKADLVEYDTKITATVNGAEVTVGNSIAEPQKWNSQMTRNNNIYNDTTIQFAEQYFNKLVLTEAEDVFGRPDREWAFEGEDIGAYINYDLLKEEYTVEVTGKELRDRIGGSIVDDKDYTFHITVDGETEQTVLDNTNAPAFFSRDNLIRTNTKGVGATGKGVLTQVFVNSDTDANRGGKTVWIAIINTYLAKATDDYNEKKEEADFDVYGVDNVEPNNRAITLVKNTTRPVSDTTNIETLTVENEDINVEEVKEGDFFLVHVADGKIQEMLDPETVESTINSFKNGDWVKAEGTQYDYDNTALYDPDVLDQYDQNNMKDTNYRIFLDEYGYAIAIEIIDEPDQYVFLTGIDGKTSNLAKKTAEGNVIHLDGTMETVSIDMDKSRKVDDTADSKWSKWSTYDLTGTMNTWCKYSVSSNGVYTLTEIADTTASYTTPKNKTGQGQNTDYTSTTANNVLVTLDKSHLTLNGIQNTNASPMKRVYGNDDSIFLMAEVEEVRATQRFSTTNNGAQAGTAGEAVIINNVASVTTGVRNVNLKAWNAQAVKNSPTPSKPAYSAALLDTSNGVYTLFNDKGFVIAAVVVGEDEGTTTNYAFTHKASMKQEDYNKDGDKWVWYRDVIVNGEVVTLTEKGSSNPAIGTMQFGEWYEVKYNAEGEVRSVNRLATAAGAVPTGAPADIRYMSSGAQYPARDFREYDPYILNSKYVGEMHDVEEALENKNTVLLWQDLNAETYSLTVAGNSLQFDNKTNTGIKRGIDLSPDAKTILLQDEKVDRNTYPTAMQNVYDYTGGGTGVAKAIKHLEKNNEFRGYVGAVFENGVATSVILWDRTASFVNTGFNPNPGPGGNGPTFTKLTDNGNNSVTVRYYDPDFGTADQMSADDVAAYAADTVASYFGRRAVRNNLIISPTTGSTMATGLVYLDNGDLGVAVNVIVQRVLAVKLDGEVKGYVDAKNAALGGAETVDVTAANWDLSSSAAAITGSDKLLNQDTGSAITLSTGVTTTTSDGDKNLYTGYAVTLNNSVTATVTGEHQTNAAKGALVAKGATLNLKLTGIADGKEYQLSDTTNNKKIGSAKKLANATDELTATYTVEGTVAIGATSGKRVTINNREILVDDSAAVDVDDLAKEAGVYAGDYGKYLVELNSTTGVATVADDITDGTVAAGFFTDGKSYEFGYYELKIATAFADTNMAHTTVTTKLNGNTVATPTTSFYGKADDVLTCDVVTDADGFTAGRTTQTLTINGTVPTITISEAYDSGTAPTITAATGLITYTAAEAYASGTITATWTVAAADIADIAFAVATA